MFDKNLSKLNNIRLKEKLKSIPFSECSEDVAFVNTLDGNVVFLKDDIPTEDTERPIEYAKSLVTQTIKSFKHNDVVINIGFGVGYVLDELFSSTKSKIVVYEPDIKYLRFIFETVDLSEYLSDRRVYISDNEKECIDFVLKNYLNEDKLEFVISKIQAIFYKDEIKSFTEALYNNLKSKIIDVNTIKTLSKKWVNNIIDFINLDKKHFAIQDFTQKFSGKSALVLGAGPSLLENIEHIKSMQDKFVIFAGNRALKTLEKYNIVPDFAVFSDSIHIKKTYTLSEEYTSKLNIIMDFKSDTSIAELNSKNLIVYFSDNESFLRKYSNDLGLKLLPSEQTTTIQAFMCANYMDFEKVYFCGFDLAFRDNSTIYADDKTLDITSNTAVIEREEKHLVQVPSINGKQVLTREDYSVFIKTMESIIKTKGLKNIFNITNFGAYIEGMSYTSFDSINIYGTKPDIDMIIKDTPFCKKEFKKYIEKERVAIIEIHENILNRVPISIVAKKIIASSTLLFEYMQSEFLDYSRNPNANEAVDIFYSKAILAIDILLNKIKYYA